MTTREWLMENHYEDVAKLIDDVLVELKAKGTKERRNWWDILSGGTQGKAKVVAGREFPVLHSAQKRQGKPFTPNAIRRNKRERPPPIRITERWPSK